jgi:hypothetical protein
MTDIFLIALGSIPLAVAVVKQKLDNRGVSPRQLREHLSEAKLPQQHHFSLERRLTGNTLA